MDRDEDGRPKPPPLGTVPSERQLFEHRCFLAGVYDPAAVARLWQAEQARRREAAG